MCGIAGILNRTSSVARETIERMTETMAHRGPDAQGIFTDRELAFGHRRLSIIDLSRTANQPMEDATGRYVIVFNGEIYNFAEIRPRLKEYPFRTKGDTEVILAGYATWGPAVLERLRGMYSIVIWDKQERSLFIARDPLGVKPLYYFKDENQFVFASELRSVLALTSVPRRLDEAALSEYFRYQSIGYPYTPVQGISQLKAGSWMKVKNGEITTGIHWQPTERHADFNFTEEKQVQHKVRELLLQSIQRRLVSDVPVAAFLSGGIDSSAVVGLMAEAGAASPNTFTVSFEEKAYDESAYAAIIAQKFSTRHTMVRLRPEDMLDALPAALDAMDIPTGDGINTYIVSRAIHEQGIRVALSGAGGDELFAGYPIFDQYIKLQKQSWIWSNPAWLRRSAALVLSGSGKKERMRQLISGPGPDISDVYPVFRQLLSPAALRRLTTLRGEGGASLAQLLRNEKEALRSMPFYSQVTAAEYIGYTQATLLKDTDQMSMAHSLEIREPFFDQDLVEFVLGIPDHFKVPAYPKRLLVESLKPMIPGDIVHRKKQGFVFPWREWMKRDLKAFCERHIRQMADRSFINSDALKMMWLKFLSGDPSIRWQEIWLFVVLDHWLEKKRLRLSSPEPSGAGGTRKKILILADWYEPGYQAGGPIQSVKNFVAALRQHYNLFIVTSDRDLGDKTAYAGIATEQWVSRPPGVRVFYSASLSASRLQQLIAETAPDFIYLNSLYSYRYSIQPLLLLWRGKIAAKIILSPRGMLRASAVAHKSKKKKPFLALLRLLGLPAKILFHATDEQEKQDIRTHFPKAGPVTLIPNFSPALEPDQKPLEKISGQLQCVFIGRIMDIKNLAFFTGMLSRLPATVHLKFSIFGSVENESYWAAIRDQIAALPANLKVEYHGPVPHAEVRAVLDRHHLFILPTRGENFGHAIFEAFAAGRPVLISDKTPWRMLQTKDAGWDLPLDDAGPWLKALEGATGWDQAAFDKHAAAAFGVAKDYQAKTDLTAAYQQLFS